MIRRFIDSGWADVLAALAIVACLYLGAMLIAQAVLR
jgi:hypothetical protein